MAGRFDLSSLEHLQSATAQVVESFAKKSWRERELGLQRFDWGRNATLLLENMTYLTVMIGVWVPLDAIAGAVAATHSAHADSTTGVMMIGVYRSPWCLWRCYVAWETDLSNLRGLPDLVPRLAVVLR